MTLTFDEFALRAKPTDRRKNGGTDGRDRLIYYIIKTDNGVTVHHETLVVIKIINMKFVTRILQN